MVAQTPIVNAGLKYVNGMNLARTANKTMTVAAGAARDQGNTNDIVLDAQVIINGLAVGANGVDLAVLVASSLYAVYIIGDSTVYNDPAAILSLNATAPNLPAGYDMYRRVGWARTDSSANLLQFWQYGNGQSRMYYYDVGITELTAGAATSFTAIDLATSVPPIVTEVLFDILFTPDGATEVAEFLPFGSTATNGIVNFGTGVAAAQRGMIVVPTALDSGVPKALYKVASGDTLTVLTAGFKDFLA